MMHALDIHFCKHIEGILWGIKIILLVHIYIGMIL